MHLGIVAGEASGDLLGADLIHSLRELQPDLTVSGIGGPAMISAGCQSLYNMESLSVIGLIEPLKHLPELFKIRRGLYQHFIQRRPDVFIGIDSPDFNLGLEIQLKKHRIPVVHYVSPSVWAWRQKRIFKIAKAVDLMLTLFPFEADFYRKHQVPVEFVGHPFAHQITEQADPYAARKRLNLDPAKRYIALMPGSRRTELKHLGKLFLETAALCRQQLPDVEFITSCVNAERHQEFFSLFQKFFPGLPVHFYTDKSRDVLAACDAVLAASGTVTLEAMLFKKPMIIAYRIGNLTFQIAKRVVKLSFVGLPNLLLNEKIIPEFIQDDAKPELMAQALLEFFHHPEKIQALEKKFQAVHTALRKEKTAAAEAVLNQLR